MIVKSIGEGVGIILWSIAGCLFIVTPLATFALFIIISFDDRSPPYFPDMLLPFVPVVVLVMLWFSANLIWRGKLNSRFNWWAALFGILLGVLLTGYQASRMPIFHASMTVPSYTRSLRG